MMASNVSNPAVDNEKHPSWWNMPITEATKSLMPKVRQDLGDDYKEELTDILEKRFHKILCGYSEASTMEAADEIGKKIMDVVYSMK